MAAVPPLAHAFAPVEPELEVVDVPLDPPDEPPLEEPPLEDPPPDDEPPLEEAVPGVVVVPSDPQAATAAPPTPRRMERVATRREIFFMARRRIAQRRCRHVSVASVSVKNGKAQVRNES
jgi:hypothetical protein